MSKRIGLKVLCTFLLLSIAVMNLPSFSSAKFNMSYLYGSYDYASLVDKTNGTLNEVSPSYFDIKSDGSLKLNTVDTDFVTKMHNQGITVSPFLSNHWDRAVGRSALNNKEKLVTQIVTAIEKYNLDGVNVDLENLTEADKNDYVELVKLLKQKLPDNKTVSVAVSANPNGWSNGWQGSYDYKKLGEYADYLMIMAYDEHYEGGEAGAVASLEFVENSIKYALKYVSSDKIVLGVPFFGRYWKEGVSYGGYGVTTKKIEEIVKKYNSSITYDTQTESVKAVVTISKNDTYPVVNGKKLTAGTYVFWYENEQSLTKKLELVNKYNLKGSGSWSLGQESESTWNYYETAVEGRTRIFADVSNNHWAYKEIIWAKNNGYVEGKTASNFEPESSLTRAEFTTLICRVLGYNSTESSEIFTDIKNHWANKSITALAKTGILNGYADGSFKPDALITREEVAKVMYYLSKNENLHSTIEFSDVSKDRWSYQYICQMSALEIVEGYENGTFKPENPIKRAEIVAILYRMFA